MSLGQYRMLVVAGTKGVGQCALLRLQRDAAEGVVRTVAGLS